LNSTLGGYFVYRHISFIWNNERLFLIRS
jgi:hypothetical protein